MSKIEMLRLLINQRLTAAAEEIFGVFGRTIAEYEEEISRSRLEIDRQRRLLELCRKPRISLQADSSAVSDQRDWSSSLDLNEEEPSTRVKEEEQEQDVWIDHPDELPGRRSEQNNVSFVLFQNRAAETQLDNGSTGSPVSKYQSHDLGDLEMDPQPGTSIQQTCSDLTEDQPGFEADAGNSLHDCLDAGLTKALDSYICTICGQGFYERDQWTRHMRIHRKIDGKVDKSFTCDICGKRLTRSDGYQKHLRVHTGEKPYSCHVCGRSFSDNSNYKRHMRRHTREKTQQSSS
ncbi:PREDICTED: zinc finger protein with KRAB and SCAN domains 1-like [Cyprinodon variegatus]|uniref:Zinc finger protein with KRAB and SCAN domains 1-like n=1 Tax=Cyprinodon variegatus TaxID=28743 RepID=A0A3Q2FIY0_CYPVA|nr:PREDICTED: zinc finger protein with KRAB and SCAN domains 1-like [Cyprinodon variegatus]